MAHKRRSRQAAPRKRWPGVAPSGGANAGLARLVEEALALGTFSNSLTERTYRDLLDLQGAAQRMHRNEARRQATRLRDAVGRLKDNLGCPDDISELLRLYAKATEAPGDSVLYVAVDRLCTLLPKIRTRYPRLLEFPRHAVLEVDAQAKLVERPAFGDIVVLEAILFEDMCALYNLARQRRLALTRAHTKEETKTVRALARGTLAATFAFLEAYVNGIAAEYVIENERELDSMLDASSKGLLVEWDFKKDRPRFVSLRDKILQYPRIVAGLAQPPFLESNCTELKALMDTAKRARDAFVHSTVLTLKGTEGEATKLETMLRDPFPDAEAAVDSAVGLVRKLERAMGKAAARLFWLHGRGPDGFFPSTVFD